MKETILEILEFSLNTCLKTFLLEGKQDSFDILASNGYSKVVEEMEELIQRGIVTSEFDIDFCKKVLAMHGSRQVIEDYIHSQERSSKVLDDMNIRKSIRLQKPL